MADDEISNLSFRDAQKRCKDSGLKSGGKLIDLQQRLRDYLENQHIAEPEDQVPASPILGGSPVTPSKRVTPSAELRTRAIARHAMTMATSTPLPAEYAKKDRRVVEATGEVPGQAKSRSWALPFVFIIMSVVLAALTMYTYRINWKPVMDHAKSDVQAGVREYTRQASSLYNRDVETATATYHSTKEALVTAPETIKAYYDGYMGNASSADAAGRSCQTPPTEGLMFIRGGPSQVLSSETEETLNGFFRFHADCSNTWQRKISVSYAGDFENGEDPVEVAERLMESFGCNSEEHMKGKCAIVDIAAVNKMQGTQGAALQRVVAKQLRVEPSSMFLMLNAHELDDSGAAVMLSLMGEFGMLNEPDCDLETRFSVQLLLVERTPGDDSFPLTKLEKAWTAKLDKDQETALALVRRISDRPVRVKAKGATWGSPKAAQALAAASAKMKADKEAAEKAAAEKEASKASQDAAAKKAEADAAAKKLADEAAAVKAAQEAALAKANAEAEAAKEAAAAASHTEL